MSRLSWRTGTVKPDVKALNSGRVVDGFTIEILIDELDERHEIFVGSLVEETVKSVINEFVFNRAKVLELTGDTLSHEQIETTE